jgi:hypothetical protein
MQIFNGLCVHDDGSVDEYRFNFLNIDCIKNMSTELKNSVTKISFEGVEGKYRDYDETDDDVKRYNENVIKVIRLFPNVIDLCLTFFTELTDDHFAELGFACLENLNVLRLNRNCLLTEKTFGRIARTCKKLKSFSFSNDLSEFYLKVEQDDMESLISGNQFLVDIHLMVDRVSIGFLEKLRDRDKFESLCLNLHDWCINSSKIIGQILALARVKFVRVSLWGQPVYNFISKVYRNQKSYLRIENVAEDQLPLDDLISILEVHGDKITILHFEDFPTMTEDVLKTIYEKGSDNLETIRFVNCNTNFSTQKDIQNFIDHSPCLKFLFLDGYGQGGSVKVFTGNAITLRIVDRDYEDDFTTEVAEMLIKHKLVSEYNEEFLIDSISGLDQHRIAIRQTFSDAIILSGEKRKRDM